MCCFLQVQEEQIPRAAEAAGLQRSPDGLKCRANTPPWRLMLDFSCFLNKS